MYVVEKAYDAQDYYESDPGPWDEEELQECVSCGKPESDEGEGPGIMLLCDNCPAAFHAVCCHPKPSYASTFAQTGSPVCS